MTFVALIVGQVKAETCTVEMAVCAVCCPHMICSGVIEEVVQGLTVADLADIGGGSMCAVIPQCCVVDNTSVAVTGITPCLTSRSLDGTGNELGIGGFRVVAGGAGKCTVLAVRETPALYILGGAQVLAVMRQAAGNSCK